MKQTLKEWREQRQMSREQLAALSGVSYPTIARLESKPDAKPGIDVAINLAQALGVAVEDIEWGKPFGATDGETPKDTRAVA